MTEPIKPELLVTRLGSDNEAWRIDAEARLIALGDPAVGLLIGALGHANPAVRIRAVRALSRIGNARAIPAVLHALADLDDRGAGAIAAEKALIEWGAAVKPGLLEVARTGSEAVRARAVRALGRIGGGDLQAPLLGLLADPAPGVRTQAAVALSLVLGTSSVELICPLLTDPDKWVRYEVAEALVKLGSTRGEAALEEARKDPEERGSHVQFWAEDLLDQISELRRTGTADLT